MALGVVRVDTVGQAASVLAAERDAYFIGGGTLLMREFNGGDAVIGKVILSDGLGLDTITVSGERVEIGAAVTMAAVAAHPELAFLAGVAGEIGGPAVRAMATVGGNLFAPSPYGDFSVALLALDARVALAGAEETTSMELATFLLRRDDARPVVRSVAFTRPPEGSFRFVKVMRRKPHGASVLAIAANLPIAEGRVHNPRVAYGAMAPTAVRARAVEEALDGRLLDAEAIAAAASVATQGCRPSSDAFASDWYRMNVLPVHLSRLLGA